MLNHDYKLGIVRYAENYDMYFKTMLEEKGFNYEVITEFTYKIIMSKNSPLAKLDTISTNDLADYIEIAHECPAAGYEVTDSCRGCLAHRCEDACKRGAISFDHNHVAHIDKSKCVECGQCAKVCPYSAIVNRKRPCQVACKVKAISINEDILFDAAYEIFIEEENIPHSIYELDGADKCAIEICSLSKTAGFTGTRLGYTVVPRNLVYGGMNLNEMWSRNRETRTNGVSYILQKGALAVFTSEGQQQIHDNLRVYKENASCFMEALDAAGIWYTGGRNSPYIWMKCPDGMSGWEFFDYLLKEIQVVGIPGDGFGECGKGYFRFSTFGKPEETKEAANRLCRLLTKE